VRIAAARALVATGCRDALLELVPLLADKEFEVRAGVADAIGALGSPAAAAVLHLKLLTPGENLDVRLACITALLHCLPSRYLRLASEYLDGDDLDVAEIAALALGEWRDPSALPLLRRALEGRRAGRFTASVLVAIAMLRTDDAPEHLLLVLEGAAEPIAKQALDALAVHAHVPRVAMRVREIVERRGAVSLLARLGRFGQ
jgi:HEAT repeat protein